MPRWFASTLRLLIALCLGGIALSSCASASAPASGDQGSSSSVSWDQEGDILNAYNREHNPDSPAGIWAYQSDPLDVAENGTYTISVQVPNDFTIANGAGFGGMGVAIPPDAHFRLVANGPLDDVRASGDHKTFFFSATVTDLSESYTGLTVWIHS